MAKEKDPKATECSLFYCDNMRGGYCCRKCASFKRCKNPCLNDPAKCGYHRKDESSS